MADYLDTDGLSYFWGKIKAIFTTKQDTLVSGTNIKTINNQTLLGSGNIDIQGGGGDVTDVEVNGVSVVDQDGVAEVIVPTKTSDLTNDSDFVSDASYVHTDNNFTTTLKDKLDGIEAGAEVNPTYTAVTGKPTGNQTPAFGGTATVSQISQDATGQISATDRTITIPDSVATTSANGLMSSSDKTKLDGIEAGAEVNDVNDVEVDGTSVVSGGVASIDLTGKQDTLVSGTNIKTINNQSILGSGNLPISGGGGISFDDVYPVGSIYMSVNNVNPSNLFGGTWTQIEDSFLLSAGSTYSGGDTGGESTVTLTPSEIPAHTHGAGTLNITASGSHAHKLYYQQDAGSGTTRNRVTPNGTTGTAGVNNATQTATHTHPSSSFSGDTAENVGGGGAHNNMPPYLVVYMWKRTA